jgi:hypothetical protein
MDFDKPLIDEDSAGEPSAPALSVPHGRSCAQAFVADGGVHADGGFAAGASANDAPVSGFDELVKGEGEQAERDHREQDTAEWSFSHRGQ